MNAMTFTSHIRQPVAAEPVFDATCDATEEWREVSIFDDCEDRAVALFRSDWEQEPRGADDVGDWVEVFELIGLRIISPNGAIVVLGRRDALDALGPVAVAALDRAMADAANIE